MIWVIGIIAYGIMAALCLTFSRGANILNERYDAQTSSMEGK